MIDSMPSSNMDWTKYAPIIISGLALAYAFWKDRKMNIRMQQVEKAQELEKQEAALRRSRASAPYFTPSTRIFSNIWEPVDNGQYSGWSATDDNVLSFQRKEVGKEVPENTPIIFVVDTGGKGARRISVSGDIPGLKIQQEPDINAANNLVYFKYPYVPSKHGMKQKVSFSFETEDGDKLTHTYETRHGFHEFKRIDPA